MTTENTAPAVPAVDTEFLTPAEVAARWNGRIGVRTLNNWRSTGNGPPFTKIGGAVLYPKDKLVAWEESNTVHSTSEYQRGDKPQE
jgi:hypothetical protein